MPEAKINFEARIKDSPDRIYVDAAELKQVLMNILLNALDAVGPGGKIRLDMENDESHFLFTVTDNGPGMDESIRGATFQPFFTTRSNDGTGIGDCGAAHSKEHGRHHAC